MIEWDFNVDQLTGAEDVLAQLDRRIQESVGMEIFAMTEAVGLRVAAEFEPHSKTGETLRSMRMMVKGDVGIVSMSRGALPVETGVRPHGPVVRKFMHWVNDLGEWFATWVNGSPADRYVERALGSVDLAAPFRQIGQSIFSVIHRK